MSSKNDEKNSAEVSQPGITQEAIELAAKAIWNVPPIREGRCSWEQFDEQAKRGTDKLRVQATAALEAALPAIRQQVAEEIAVVLEAEALSDYDAADDLHWAAAKARQIGAGTADARTGTPAAMDLPQASDAVSNRLPEVDLFEVLDQMADEEDDL